MDSKNELRCLDKFSGGSIKIITPGVIMGLNSEDGSVQVEGIVTVKE